MNNLMAVMRRADYVAVSTATVLLTSVILLIIIYKNRNSISKSSSSFFKYLSGSLFLALALFFMYVSIANIYFYIKPEVYTGIFQFPVEILSVPLSIFFSYWSLRLLKII